MRFTSRENRATVSLGVEGVEWLAAVPLTIFLLAGRAAWSLIAGRRDLLANPARKINILSLSSKTERLISAWYDCAP
jgi:hypothetical protein